MFVSMIVMSSCGMAYTVVAFGIHSLGARMNFGAFE